MTTTDQKLPIIGRERALIDAIYVSLMRQAKEQTLFVSPPYGSERTRNAFLSGYETALRDMSYGRLKP